MILPHDANPGRIKFSERTRFERIDGVARQESDMLFDLVGSKIMTVYVAEIKGRGIAGFHANGSDAERRVRDGVVRDVFMVLATGGLPLWDGVTDIEVRLARPDEEVKWRASRAKAIRQD